MNLSPALLRACLQVIQPTLALAWMKASVSQIGNSSSASKAIIAAHPIRQVKRSGFVPDGPPCGRHQCPCGLPDAEFAVKLIGRRREGFDNYCLWFTHDCPSRRGDAARSFRGSKDVRMRNATMRTIVPSAGHVS